IPPNVTALFKKYSVNAARREFVVIPDAPHPLTMYLAENLKKQREIIDLVCAFTLQ
ncbi:MAG: hypothetical protein JWM96_801, partial [Alphaproteobacteria bacterium]|nr:hypothetical protein [Alphaproteobacteria bacterium]